MIYNMNSEIFLLSHEQGTTMKNYICLKFIEIFFLYLLILMTVLLISAFGCLIISWRSRHWRVHEAVLLEHTLRVAELEHRLAALNSAPKTAEKANAL
jgi:hypothetical protein